MVYVCVYMGEWIKRQTFAASIIVKLCHFAKFMQLEINIMQFG